MLRNVLTWFRPRDDLPVFGTAVTREMDQGVTVPAEHRDDPLQWTTITASSQLEVGDLRFRFALTDHPVETLAVRVDHHDATFAFSSDTGPGWSFRALGSDIDLAFCDASHLAAEEDRGIPHMSAREAGSLGRAADIDRLVVTHLVPGSDPGAHRAEASEAYGGPVDVALPGLVFDV